MTNTQTSFEKATSLETRNLSLPKHKRVTRCILGYIKQNDLKPGDKIPGERELAKMLGVSTLTVGKSLATLVEQNLLSRQVGSGTYVAESRFAQRMLAVRRFGLITRYLEDDPYALDIQKGLNRAIAQAGFEQLTLYQNFDTYLFSMQQHDLIGLAVITPLESSLKELAYIKKTAPLAIIGAEYESFEDVTFSCDDHGAICKAVEYLVSLGHRRIGVLTAAAHRMLQTRFEGYLQGMFQAALPVNPRWILRADHYDGISINEEISKQMAHALRSESAPTAIVAPTSSLMLTAFRTAEALNLRIPQDLSILGFEEIPRGQHVGTAPTILTQPTESIGYAAGKHLSASFKKEKVETRHLHEANLIVRNSCCPPKHG